MNLSTCKRVVMFNVADEAKDEKKEGEEDEEGVEVENKTTGEKKKI